MNAANDENSWPITEQEYLDGEKIPNRKHEFIAGRTYAVIELPFLPAAVPLAAVYANVKFSSGESDSDGEVI